MYGIRTMAWTLLLIVSMLSSGVSAQTTPLSEESGLTVVDASDLLSNAGPLTSQSDNAGDWDRTDVLLASLTIFVLAIFVGFELITKVPPTLHTPLMSGSNAISGITLVGALLLAGNQHSPFAAFLGMVAVALAMVNVVGGFLVTDRMLSMFRR